jgi:hypothetical protein
LVFCRFGGRLETTLYIHFTRRWVKSTRRSSASRRKKREGRGGRERRSSQLGWAVSQRRAEVGLPLCFSWDWLCGVWRFLGASRLVWRLCIGGVCDRCVGRRRGGYRQRASPPLLASAGREALLLRHSATASIGQGLGGGGGRSLRRTAGGWRVRSVAWSLWARGRSGVSAIHVALVNGRVGWTRPWG